MKFSKILLIGFCFCSAFTYAETNHDNKAGAYIGLKGGGLNVDDLPLKDNPKMRGSLIGYHFGNGFSTELEYLTGSAYVKNRYGYTNGNEIEVSNLALYGTYRTPGRLYALAKLGILNEKLATITTFNEIETEDTGLSYGAGVGIRFTKHIGLEVEYTVVEQDADLYSGTLKFTF